MNGIKPNCLNDFLFSNACDRDTLELILQRRLPFPFAGKSGILLHGTWGTGKTTLAQLLPALLETAYSGTWNQNQGAGHMAAPEPDHSLTEFFRCGGGLSSATISQKVDKYSQRMPVWHFSQHHYFVFDEFDRLTIGAQQSLRSTMDLPRCMFLFTTNYLNKIDRGIVNRCHLVEMNQVTTPSAYLPLGRSILRNMGVTSNSATDDQLQTIASKARGSLREFSNAVVLEGIGQGGVLQD